jgi:hypothetical protein
LAASLVFLVVQPFFSFSELLPNKSSTVTAQKSANVYSKVSALEIPLPASSHTFRYFPLELPVADSEPKFSKPIGLGSVADGGSTLDVRVRLEPFSGSIDIYAAYTVSVEPAHVYVLNPDGATFVPFSVNDILAALEAGEPPAGAVAWKSGVTGMVDVGVLGEMDATKFQVGTYEAHLLVTPAGDFTRYYLWTTTFDIAVPGTFNIHGDGTGYGLTDANGEAILQGALLGLPYDREFVITDGELNPIPLARIFIAGADGTEITYISDPDEMYEPVFIMGEENALGNSVSSSVLRGGGISLDDVLTTIQTSVTLNETGDNEIYTGFHDTVDFSLDESVGDRIISYMNGLHPVSEKTGVYCMTIEEIVQFFREETEMVGGLLTIAPLVPVEGTADIADSAIRVIKEATTSARSDFAAFFLKSYEAGKLTNVPQWLTDLDVKNDRIPFVVLSDGLVPHGVVLVSAPYARVLLSPRENESFSGITPVEVRSCDIQGIQEIRLYVDESLQETVIPANPYAGEYVIDWDTTMVPEDGHTIFIKSTNSSRWTRESYWVFAIVDNLVPSYYQASLLDVEQNRFYSQLFANLKKMVNRIVN